MLHTVVFVVALASTWAILPRLIKFCQDRNLYDLPSPRKIHTRPTPRLGGLAIASGCLLSWGIGYLFWNEVVRQFGPILFWILAGALAILALGLWDDLKPLRYRYKFIVEAAIGLMLVLAGLKTKVLFLPIWGTVELGWLEIPVSLIWFLALLNSVNLIDGLDGLAGGVSFIIAATLFVVGIHFHAHLISFLMIAVGGALVSLLRYNLHPARIFMGDSGSLYLGYFFAVSSLICPIKSFTAVAMFVPLVALGVPLLETASSFIRRSARLKKFYLPDNRHLYNLLLEAGLSASVTVLVFYLISLCFSGLSLFLMFRGRDSAGTIIGVVVFLALLVSAGYYINGRRVGTKEDKKATA